ncbi:uncharacterized protein LOC127137946 [Lathyrus oleraceus]|uniref:uncharacterized protein LOC127137946 n=1 Tax=Pisum sativum TaxID=3888 RepID=UPI0021CE3BFF|nr:uncharacterized protein LOC127137946 [Pisum sativum]
MWNELKKVFLARYFPPSKTTMLKAQINGFKQKDNESLFEAWERYKDMMRLCRHHSLEEWLIIHTFYNGLLYNTRLTIDAAASDALMDKPYNEVYQLIESMAQNHYQWGREITFVEKPQPKGDMYELSNLDHVNTKVDALTQKIDNLTITPAATVAAVAPNCEICEAQGHTVPECQLLTGTSIDQVNYAQGNPYSNTYNPSWKNNPNFSYKNNKALYAPNQAPVVPPGYHKAASNTQNAPRKSNLEIMMENFIATQAQTNKDFLNQNIRTSEQIKQLANKPQPNPKGHANAIILRSGTELDGPTDPRSQNSSMHQDPGKVTEKECEQEEDKNEEAIEKEEPYVPPPPYKPISLILKDLLNLKV